MLRVVTQIGGSWEASDRRTALRELAEVLKSLHETELEAEQIDDPLIRAHVFDRLEVISARRRSVVEEIRWDLRAAETVR